MMNALEKVRKITEVLKKGNITSPGEEAELLVRRGLDINRAGMYRDNPRITGGQMKRVDGMVERRLTREPLQYILGYEDFLGLKLLVGPGVLIPRPETEFMAEKVIEAVKREALNVKRKDTTANSRFTANVNTSRITHHASFNVLDVCTGSGCIALAIAKEFPVSDVCGTDISESAIAYANLNAGVNSVSNAVFLKGPLFKPVESLISQSCFPFKFDLIISNPPYIKRNDLQDLQPEIKNWEPVIALDGGIDGLGFYRELIPGARRFLNNDGLIMLEIGAGQSKSVTDIMGLWGYSRIKVIKDLAGIERIIQAQWKK
jgi:release factor glutamine methyltransferase